MYIQHISHSGFLVCDQKYVLLFDCIDKVDFQSVQDKDILFFSSHHHRDHYSRTVAQTLSSYNTTYILSDDIEDPGTDPERTCSTGPYKEFTLGPIRVRTFSSTDRGISFYVEMLGNRYFHSGDLNWWHWKRMSPAELAAEERDFKKELEKIAPLPIDYAFVPVDPRLEEFGLLAANYFCQTLHPKYLIPMHSFGDYGYYDNLESRLSLGSTKLIPCQEAGQKIWEERV